MSEIKKREMTGLTDEQVARRKKKQHETWARDDHATIPVRRERASKRRNDRIDEARKIAKPDPADKTQRVVGQYYLDHASRICVAVNNGSKKSPKLNKLDNPKHLEYCRSNSQVLRRQRIDSRNSP